MEPAVPSIAAIAAADDRFDILVNVLTFVDSAIPGSNLLHTLSAPSSDLTVFAPTDAAFGQLAQDLGFAGNPANATAVTNFLTGALDAATLRTVLLYHVSAGTQLAADIAAQGSVTTLTGATITTDLPTLIDAEPDLIDPSLIQTDVIATNGVIHAIDRVLLPVDLAGNDAPTITEIVAASGGTPDGNRGDFDILLQAVTTAGLADALNDRSADLTVFAPTDAAFLRLAEGLGYSQHSESGAFAYIADALTLLSGGGDPVPLLQSILTFHVAPESLQASQVLSRTSIDTLFGTAIGQQNGRLVDADPDFKNAGFVTTDIQAANGVVHVINGVLLPVDIPTFGGPNGDELVIADNAANILRTNDGNDLIDGNGGNDIIVAGSGNDLALGGTGNDRLSGGRANDTLLGGDGLDVLYGGHGVDRLGGGKGHDILEGGGGRDVFVFATGDGRDIVTDFKAGTDRIDLSGSNFDDFADLAGRIVDGLGLTEIRLGGGDVISLWGVDAADLSARDFLFA